MYVWLTVKKSVIECLRDIGLEQDCLDVATPSHNMAHTRWCRSMAGEEFARVYSWGHDPKHKVRQPPCLPDPHHERLGDLESSTPNPQTSLPCLPALTRTRVTTRRLVLATMSTCRRHCSNPSLRRGQSTKAGHSGSTPDLFASPGRRQTSSSRRSSTSSPSGPTRSSLGTCLAAMVPGAKSCASWLSH